MKALDVDHILLTHPRTGDEMRFQLLPYSVVRSAERDAMSEWRARYSFMTEVHAFFQASEWESLLALHRMAVLLQRRESDKASAWQPWASVGIDWILAQDHIALAFFRQEMERFEREVDPRMGRDMLQADVDALVEHVKKNGVLPADLWQSYAPSTLLSCMHTLASRLATSQTSASSNGGTGESSATATMSESRPPS
jgi:hypothetical protein